MTSIRNLIIGLYLAWAVRPGPCLHPLYCRVAPPGQRWSAVARAIAIVTLYAFLLAAIFIASVIGGTLWLVYGPGPG